MERERQNGRPQVAEFISKLYAMMENQEFKKIVSWDKSGTEIRFRNQRQLQYFILPTYFRHGNVVSFIRQLNNYGFSNVSNLNTRKGELSFRNQHFRKDYKQDLKKIHRKSKKSLIRKPQQQNEQPKHSKQVLNNVLQIGKQCLQFAKNRPAIFPELTGIFNLVNRMVFPPNRMQDELESINSFMCTEQNRATYNMLQTFKDTMPLSLKKYDSICSFDGGLSKINHELPE